MLFIYLPLDGVIAYSDSSVFIIIIKTDNDELYAENKL